MNRISVLLPVSIAVLFAGCASEVPAPVSDRQEKSITTGQPPAVNKTEPEPGQPKAEPLPPVRFSGARPETYTVRKGDTLFSIARELGVDYRELAAWNQLESPSLIKVGQVLRLTAATAEAGTMPPTQPVVVATLPPVQPVVPAAAQPVSAAPAPEPVIKPIPAPPLISEPQAVKRSYTAQTLIEMPSRPPVAQPGVPAADNGSKTRVVEGISWTWPAQGKLLGEFSETGNNKGVDIGGEAGQPVLAASGGKVVYSGSGLRGYGKLIIIRHSETYLSAYAHNREILVKEGETVSQGQKIGEMGDTDSDQVKLHFEIREGGKPVDPMRFLPTS
jgi:lipoprotein NlpD